MHEWTDEFMTTIDEFKAELSQKDLARFEKTVFALHPELADIKKRLLDAGAEYAAMTGSGSTVFGLFEHNAEGRTASDLRLLEEEFAPMIIFNNTL